MPSAGASGLPGWQILLWLEEISHQCKIIISQDTLLSTRVAFVEVEDCPLASELLCLLPKSHLGWRSAGERKSLLIVVFKNSMGIVTHLQLQKIHTLCCGVLWSLDGNRRHDCWTDCNPENQNDSQKIVIFDWLFRIFKFKDLYLIQRFVFNSMICI